MSIPPQLAGQPVILAHLGMDQQPELTVCSGERFYPPRVGSYPNIPQAPCPLCMYFTLFGKAV